MTTVAFLPHAQPTKLTPIWNNLLCVGMCAHVCEKEKGRVYTTSAAVLGLIFRENTKGSTSPEATKKKKTATKQSRVYVEKTKKTCTHIQARELPLYVLVFFSGCVCRIVSVRTRHGSTANSMLEKLATRWPDTFIVSPSLPTSSDSLARGAGGA